MICPTGEHAERCGTVRTQRNPATAINASWAQSGSLAYFMCALLSHLLGWFMALTRGALFRAVYNCGRQKKEEKKERGKSRLYYPQTELVCLHSRRASFGAAASLSLTQTHTHTALICPSRGNKVSLVRSIAKQRQDGLHFKMQADIYI